jgi:hypothetical protein
LEGGVAAHCVVVAVDERREVGGLFDDLGNESGEIRLWTPFLEVGRKKEVLFRIGAAEY